jgi:hypothetical protein
VLGAEAPEMRAFSSFCDAAIVKKRPILKGQTNGFNLLRQSACTGFSPFCTLFLAYFCLLSAISSKLMGPDPKLLLATLSLQMSEIILQRRHIQVAAF